MNLAPFEQSMNWEGWMIDRVESATSLFALAKFCSLANPESFISTCFKLNNDVGQHHWARMERARGLRDGIWQFQRTKPEGFSSILHCRVETSPLASVCIHVSTRSIFKF